MRVAVVGGGVVGLCAAEALQRRGADVVVLEADRCGRAASAGNAGWISPGLSNPLPAPGVVPQALRWMLNPRSPLLIHPVARPSFVRFLLAFLRNTRPDRYGAGMAALVATTQRAVADFESLAERCRFEMHQDGMLFVARGSRALEAEHRVLREHQALGYDGEVRRLTAEEVRSEEPGLGDGITGGVFASAEGHVRPETVTAGVAARLGEVGVEIREHTPVESVVRSNGAWALVTADGGVEADRVVLAGGVATAKLLAPFGVRLPLLGAKGYSLTLEQPPIKLKRPIYLVEDKVGVSPYDGAIRLAGTLELGSKPGEIHAKRVAGIREAGARALRDWSPDLDWSIWTGERPLLPDGLPAIGPVPGNQGLFVATGHAMLGVTLAPTTAELLAPAVLDGRPSLELAPFSLARFDLLGAGKPRETGARG
jgi:D-amino-acid dehydrogenase